MSTPQDSTAPVPILPSDPAYVADKTNAVRYSERSSDWIAALSPSGATEYDTGWVDVTPTAPFAHGAIPGQVRRVGKQVFFQGGIGGSITQNTTTIIGNVPAGFRPPDGARSITSGAATQGTAVYYMNVESNGDIRVRVTPTGTYNIALGALGYLVD